MPNIQSSIEEKLNTHFEPLMLEVENESHSHNVPANSETHFKVTLVSNVFEGVLPVKRHQSVYKILGEELSGPVHALALHLYTPSQWRAQGKAPESPNCMGGSKK